MVFVPPGVANSDIANRGPKWALVPEGRCDRSLARSAWDNATPKEPSRRVRYDLLGLGHRFDDWSDGSFCVGISQVRSVPSSSSSSIIGHEPFKKSI